MVIRRKKQDVPAARQLRAEKAIRCSQYQLSIETASTVRHEMRRKGLVML